MKQAILCFAGLAILGYAPVALANSSNSSSWTPAVSPVPAAISQTPSAQIPSAQTEAAQTEAARTETARTEAARTIPQSPVQPRLEIPSNAAEAPLGTAKNKSLLPPPPPIPHLPEAPSSLPSTSAEITQYAKPIPTDLGLEFDLSNSPSPSQPVPRFASPVPQATPDQVPQPVPSAVPEVSPPPSPDAASVIPLPANGASGGTKADFTLLDLFKGDSDSMVAIVVGNAEGTRTVEGGYKKGFYGHSDPGNGVWNLGTFSYQHGASSPQEADAKQLNRLQKQAEVIQKKASQRGLKLTLEETLNAIDLANQAPKAVLDATGYIELLAEAHARGMKGADAVLWARVQSFFDPQTQRWNAPGLGNTTESITRDQRRRMQAIASAIDAQDYQISADARLRPQPMSFRLPTWNLSGLVQKLATLINPF